MVYLKVETIWFMTMNMRHEIWLDHEKAPQKHTDSFLYFSMWVSTIECISRNQNPNQRKAPFLPYLITWGSFISGTGAAKPGKSTRGKTEPNPESCINILLGRCTDSNPVRVTPETPFLDFPKLLMKSSISSDKLSNWEEKSIDSRKMRLQKLRIQP